MIDKEIGEIRRHLRRERSNITALYGCYVNENKEIISSFRQSTGMMPKMNPTNILPCCGGPSPVPSAKI